MTTPQTRPDSVLSDPNGHTHDGRYHAHIGGSTPHGHTIERVSARTLRLVAGLTGFTLAACALWMPWFPANSGPYSVTDLHNMCTSGLGQIAQLVDSRTAYGCHAVTAGYGVLWLAVLVSAGLTLWGLLGGRSTTPAG